MSDYIKLEISPRVFKFTGMLMVTMIFSFVLVKLLLSVDAFGKNKQTGDRPPDNNIDDAGDTGVTGVTGDDEGAGDSGNDDASYTSTSDGDTPHSQQVPYGHTPGIVLTRKEFDSVELGHGEVLYYFPDDWIGYKDDILLSDVDEDNPNEPRIYWPKRYSLIKLSTNSEWISAPDKSLVFWVRR